MSKVTLETEPECLWVRDIPLGELTDLPVKNSTAKVVVKCERKDEHVGPHAAWIEGKYHPFMANRLDTRKRRTRWTVGAMPR